MEKINTTSWLMHNIRMLLRILLCVFNATLWLFVLFFSVHEDKIAAVLSYFAVMLTVILIKYGFREIQMNGSIASIVDILSNTLIVAGFSFALSQFWNTSFYAICLGIMVQKLKYEVELKSINVVSSVRVNVVHEDSKMDTFDRIDNEREANSQFHNLVQERLKIKDNLRDLRQDGKLSNKDQIIAKHVKEPGVTVNEMGSSDEASKPIDIREIPNGYQESLVPYVQKLPKYFSKECDKSAMLCTETTKTTKENTVKNASSLEKSDILLKSQNDSNNESKILEVTSVCDLKAQFLNIQELELDEFSKARSNYKTNDTINVKELNRNKELNDDTSGEKLIALNADEIIKLPEDDMQQMDSIRNKTESPSQPENMLKSSFSRIQTNICSSVDLENEKGSSNSDRQNYLPDQYEIKNEFERIDSCLIKDPLNSLSSNISALDSALQCKQNSVRNNTYAVFEQEKCLLKNKNDLQRETLVIDTNEDIDSRNHHETASCIADNINIQPQITREDLMKCMSALNLDENLKTVLEKPDSGSSLTSKDSVSKTLLDLCKVSQHEKSSIKDYESILNTENKSETIELVKETSEDVLSTHFSGVSNVEDVVNTIDLGFIYSLGFNAPA